MYSPIMPRQNICNPPKKQSNIIIVAVPLGELLNIIFSNTVSKPTRNANRAIKKPKQETIRNGYMLNDVIPFKAKPIREKKLNFD